MTKKSSEGKGTPSRIRSEWEEMYQRGFRPWEENRLDDMADFLAEHLPSPQKVRTILEIGCGRGLRALLTATKLFNSSGTRYCGLDVSPEAVAHAKGFCNELKSGIVPAPLAPYLKGHPRLVCDVEFWAGDFTANELPPSTPSFDLVVDWWCLHELFAPLRKTYVDLVTRLCKAHYVLCVFDKDSSSISILPPLHPDIKKHQFSAKYIERLFEGFQILVRKELHKEDPKAKQSDGPIAAKRAYLMKRAGSKGSKR